MGIKNYQKILRDKGVNQKISGTKINIGQPQGRKRGTEKWRNEETANEGMRNWRWGSLQLKTKRKERTNREEINKQIESNKIKKARKRWRMKKGRKARNESQYCFCDSLDMFWSCCFFLLIRHPLVFATGFMRVFFQWLMFFYKQLNAKSSISMPGMRLDEHMVSHNPSTWLLIIISWVVGSGSFANTNRLLLSNWLAGYSDTLQIIGDGFCEIAPRSTKNLYTAEEVRLWAHWRKIFWRCLIAILEEAPFQKRTETKCSKHISTGAFHSVLVSGMFLILLQQSFPIFAVI